MTSGLWRWLLRPSIGRRIAGAMLISLFAVQAQAVFQVWLFARPEVRLVGTRWLAEKTNEAAHNVFSLPISDRRHFQSDNAEIRLAWSAETPWNGKDVTNSPLAARLRATLHEVLGRSVKSIVISETQITSSFPNRGMRIEVASHIARDGLGTTPVSADEPDVLLPASVRIAVQGADGTWLSAAPISYVDAGFGFPLPVTPLLAGGLIIAVVSTLTARRIVAPLDQLIEMAEQIGTAREPLTVPEKGLREFSAVAKAFEEMHHRLLRFVEDRTQMLAAISHDLRSSLTRLRLCAEECNGEAERIALNAEIDDMQAMVEMTLAFASDEARMKPTQTTDIAALLISLSDDTADAGKVCVYHGPNHIETMGHPTSLKRAFWNLIDNALKHAGGASVRLEVLSDSIAVFVEDRGPGIPDHLMQEAFKPFRRLDASRGGEKPGAGLGLTIARDVIQSHGGSIHIVNRPGGGLSVRVELPLRPSKDPRANA